MSDPQVEIEAVCELHQGSGRLMVRREGDRIVLDGQIMRDTTTPPDTTLVWYPRPLGDQQTHHADPDQVCPGYGRAELVVRGGHVLMAGRHSTRRGAHAHIPHTHIPEQHRPRPVSITDARTRIEHVMTDASAMQHRHAGRYPALCGIEVLAASLAERERSQCQPSRDQAASPAPGGAR